MKKVIISLLCFSMLILCTACSSAQPESSSGVLSDTSSNAASEEISAVESESSAQSIANDNLTATFTKGDAVIESSYDFNVSGSVDSVELTINFPSSDEANTVFTKINQYQDKFSSAEVDNKAIHVSLNDETIQNFFATQTKDSLAAAIQEQGGQIKS